MAKLGGGGLLIAGISVSILGALLMSDLIAWLLNIVGILMIVLGIVLGIIGIIRFSSGNNSKAEDF